MTPIACIFHLPLFEITLLWCKKYQKIFIITLQIYSAIINGAMDTTLISKHAIHALKFQYHSAIKMCGVLKFQHSMEYFCFMHNETNNEGGHFALKLALKCEI
jgi:hypothetical protein